MAEEEQRLLEEQEHAVSQEAIDQSRKEPEVPTVADAADPLEQSDDSVEHDANDRDQHDDVKQEEPPHEIATQHDDDAANDDVIDTQQVDHKQEELERQKKREAMKNRWQPEVSNKKDEHSSPKPAEKHKLDLNRFKVFEEKQQVLN